MDVLTVFCLLAAIAYGLDRFLSDRFVDRVYQWVIR
jgi:hypothetical protein